MSSGGALPGVTVAIASPNMIGGARTAVTDEQGVYRFTLLPGGTYTVTFTLPGFNTLNVEGVSLNAGATMTINGKMEVATLQETVTVTSQAPTIDLESSKVAVNWDQQKLDEIPYSRSLTGLVSLIPGLYATSLDVGGSSFGTGSGPAARTFGRAGGGVVSYDGMIWDQTYGDFGTYEEAQITTAAKGADAMNPGLTMNLIVKSGSNTFKGSGNIGYQNGSMQSKNVTPELLAKGYAPGVNKFTSLKTSTSKPAARSSRTDSGTTPATATHRPATSSRVHPTLGPAAGGVLHEAAGSDRQDDLPGDAEQQARGHVPGRPQVAAVSHGEPLRSTRVDPESGLDVARWTVIQISVSALVAVHLRCEPATWRLLVAGHSVDDGRPQDRPRDGKRHRATRGAFLETDRDPRRWQYGATYAYFTELWGRNHELKTGYLGWRNMSVTENIGYPNQQQYRYRSVAGDLNCDEAHNYDGCFTRPDSVLVYDYPNTTASGEWYNSAYFNDKITISRKFTLNVGVRYDRYSSFLPEQGNPGTGPFATTNIYPYRGEDDFPIYSTFVPRVSAVYDLTGEGRVAVRGSYGRYVGGSSGASANPGPGATDVNPNAIITKTYSGWDGRFRSSRIANGATDVDVRRRRQSLDRSQP